MSRLILILSMLHEAIDENSATRLFRGRPVLDWTLRRASTAPSVDITSLLCWEDQVQAIEPIALEHRATILAKGPRVHLPALQAISAARRWSDGWRGGLLGACDFDLGFHAKWTAEILEHAGADAALLVDPSAALVDPELLQSLIDHAKSADAAEMIFSQAAPGLSGVFLRKGMVSKLGSAGIHPGRLLHYMPEQPMRDPIAGETCAPVPTSVARTSRSFKLDSGQQVDRMTQATACFNGQLIRTGAPSLVERMNAIEPSGHGPGEITLELTSRRASAPAFWAGRHVAIDRPDLTRSAGEEFFKSLHGADEKRLTLGGVGDPLLHRDCIDLIAIARRAGIGAICIRTDLLGIDGETIAQLGASEVDVVCVSLPALTAPVYAKVMGIDALPTVLGNLKLLIENRQSRQRGVPIVVPVFTKLRENLHEMEEWYDQWLRILGSAVIESPTRCAGQVPELALADMSSAARKPCVRLNHRLTVLCDGRVAACEEDVRGAMPMGDVSSEPLDSVWQSSFARLRQSHREGGWSNHVTCNECREWHRP